MVAGYVAAYREAIAGRRRPTATLIPPIVPGAAQVQAG
jgi:hypothetical protein